MENFVFSKRSKNNLRGVHPDLVWVCARGLILSTLDFTVTCGLRSYEEQVRLKAEGKSKTLKSKHLKQSDGYGHAFDVVALINNQCVWEAEYYEPIVKAMKEAADELGVFIECGYDWPGHWDPYHFQINNSKIPPICTTYRADGLKIANTSL